MKPWYPRMVVLVGVLLAAAGCAASGGNAPAEPSPAPEGATAPAPSATPERARAGYAEADVRFMREMIAHHGQALAMTRLVPERSSRADVRLLAQRIDISQRDEIALMQRWLRARGEPVPSADSTGAMHAGMRMDAPMPGMVMTPAEMARLAAARGPAFDRLFLEGMIRHHEMALRMVADLLNTAGAGVEPEIFRFASDVDADQRAEIARMRAILSTLPQAGTARP